MFRAFLIAVLSAGLMACDVGGAGGSEEMLYAREHDPEMDAAMQAARDSLPTFWAHFDKRGPGYEDLLLKVAMPTTDDSLEYIWMEVRGRDEDKITGVLINQPVKIAGVSQGSTVTVSPQQVSDWNYTRDGVSYGQFTTRVFAKRMTAADRAEALSGLSPTPIEVEKP